MILAERLRQTVETCETQVEDSKVSITASIGVTGFSPVDGMEMLKPEALLNQADILLYEAKEAGRNQIKGCLLTP